MNAMLDLIFIMIPLSLLLGFGWLYGKWHYIGPDNNIDEARPTRGAVCAIFGHSKVRWCRRERNAIYWRCTRCNMQTGQDIRIPTISGRKATVADNEAGNMTWAKRMTGPYPRRTR